MNIWIDQIESQNPDLIPCDNKGTLKKTPYYIKKMRLQRFRSNSSSNMSELDQDSIKKASYPGDLASMAISKSLPNFTKMHFKCTKV